MVLLVSCSASKRLELIKTSLLNMVWKQELQWEANNILGFLWFLVQYFPTFSVTISGYAEQSWGCSTADARYQISLSSDVSFHPLSTRLGNDTSPQQLQTWLPHEDLIKPMHWCFLRDGVRTGALHGWIVRQLAVNQATKNLFLSRGWKSRSNFILWIPPPVSFGPALVQCVSEHTLSVHMCTSSFSLYFFAGFPLPVQTLSRSECSCSALLLVINRA